MEPSFVKASGPVNDNLNDSQLPAYFHEYRVHFLEEEIDTSRVDTSFIGLLPTNERGVRILNMECTGTLVPIPQGDGSVSYNWTIVWEVADIQVFRRFSLESALEGVLNLGPFSTTWNAKPFMSYELYEDRRELYLNLHLEELFGTTIVPPFPFQCNVYIQDDIIPFDSVRLAYIPYNLPYQYTGKGQTVLVTAYLNAGYLVEDIVAYLRTQGIIRTPEQIASQISWKKATYLDKFFYNGSFYNIPRSDGFLCDPPLTVLQPPCMELTMNLEFILSIAPDANILILYFGCDCDPNTGSPSNLILSEMELISFLQQHVDDFDTISDSYHHLSPSAYTDEQRTQYRNTFNLLNFARKTAFTASGNRGEPEQDFWNTLKYVVSCGGLITVFNETFQKEQVCWSNSSGGFYTEEVPFTLPDYQVGLVQSSVDGTSKLIGVPCVGGLADGLVYVYNGQGSRVRSQIAGTSCVPPVMSALACLINEATEYKRWPFIDIFYLEFDYLFTYVNKGANKVYRASDYVNWNPIAGLGWIDGTRLLELVDPKYIRSGDRLCISACFLQNRMSFLNFYPPSPFADPYIRQPVFGPKSYWSYLVVYRVDPVTGRLDLNQTVLEDGDVVCIFSALPVDLYWVMTLDDTGYVHLERYPNVVESRMKWILTFEENVWYAPFELSPFSDPTQFLNAKFLPPTPSSCPSISTRSIYSEFMFRRHTWFLESPTLYDQLKTTDVSFYMNIANLNYYMSSGYDETNYKEGREIVGTSDVVVSYEEFTPIPEFVVVPLSPPPPSSSSVALRNNQKYMFFNVRVQAYVYANPSYVLQFVNVNMNTSSLPQFLYDSCAFQLVNTQDTFQTFLFEPTLSDGPLYVGTIGATSSAARYNDFIFRGTVQNLAGYINKSTSWFTTNPDNTSGQLELTTSSPPSPSAVTLNIFTVDPIKIFSVEDPAVWLRQVNEPSYSFYNAALAPGQTVDGLPYMEGYYNGVVEQGWVQGSWRLANSALSPDTRILSPQFRPTYYYVTPQATFSFVSYLGPEQYLVNLVGNPKQWQPQMLVDDGLSTVVEWVLAPYMFSERGPASGYLYTTGLYLIRNKATNKFVSVVMDLEYTPSMLTDPQLLDVTELCVYTPRNDNYVP